MITTMEAAVHAVNYESHHIDARRRSTDELVRIAVEAKAKGAPVTFKDLGERRLSDLLKIVAAGGRWEGRVATVTSTSRRRPVLHRVCAEDALLRGHLLSLFRGLPPGSEEAPRAQW